MQSQGNCKLRIQLQKIFIRSLKAQAENSPPASGFRRSRHDDISRRRAKTPGGNSIIPERKPQAAEKRAVYQNTIRKTRRQKSKARLRSESSKARQSEKQPPRPIHLKGIGCGGFIMSFNSELYFIFRVILFLRICRFLRTHILRR